MCVCVCARARVCRSVCLSVCLSVLVCTSQISHMHTHTHTHTLQVDPALPGQVMEHLRSEAMTAYTNVRPLTPVLVGACLARVLPAAWLGVDEVQWRAGQDGQPTREWLERFWRYALGAEDHQERVVAAHDWPLLPTSEGSLCMLVGAGGVVGEESKVVDGALVSPPWLII